MTVWRSGSLSARIQAIRRAALIERRRRILYSYTTAQCTPFHPILPSERVPEPAPHVALLAARVRDGRKAPVARAVRVLALRAGDLLVPRAGRAPRVLPLEEDEERERARPPERDVREDDGVPGPVERLVLRPVLPALACQERSAGPGVRGRTTLLVTAPLRLPLGSRLAGKTPALSRGLTSRWPWPASPHACTSPRRCPRPTRPSSLACVQRRCRSLHGTGASRIVG
jgi:hypothetical protein